MTKSPSPPPGGVLKQGIRWPQLRDSSVMQLAQELIARVRDSPPSTPPELQHLGTLGVELELACERPANRFSPASSEILLKHFQHHPDFNEESIRDAVCVDVGCGAANPLGPLFLMLIAGARSGIGIDLAECTEHRRAVLSLFRIAAKAWSGQLDHLPGVKSETVQSTLSGFDLAKLACGDPDGLAADRLSFRQATLQTSGIEPASADIMFSNSFLEHVPDPDDVIRAMAEASRQGSLHLHQIDGMDHRAYGTPDMFPFEFLREKTNKPIVHDCNRIRPMEYRTMFEAHGFEVRHVRINRSIELTDADIASFAKPFRNMTREVLSPSSVSYFLRRK